MNTELSMASACEHHHTEHHDPFPPAEEDLYMDLVINAKSTSGAVAPGEPAGPEVAQRIQDIQARLPRRWSSLTHTESNHVIGAFAAQYQSLPTSHPLFEHHHNHDKEHQNGHSCGKMHGPIRRRFDALETRVLGRISNRTAKAVAAAVFRLSALTVCPGDDIAAIGLQIHGAIAGHHETEHGHHEEQAILPKSIQAVKEQATDTPKPQPAGAEAAPVRAKKRRVLALASTALIALGFGVAGDHAETQNHQPSQTAIAPPLADHKQPPIAKPSVPEQYTNQIVVRPGDTAWALAETEVATVGHAHSVAVTNAIVSYMTYLNRSQVTAIDHLKPNQTLQTPTGDTIDRIYKAVTQADSDPQLARYLTTINNQATRYTPQLQEVLPQLDSYLRSQ